MPTTLGAGHRYKRPIQVRPITCAVLRLNLQRPWGTFFGAFDLPKSWAALEKRVYSNVMYYRTNYLLLAAVLALWAFWSNWRMPFAFGLLLPLWMYVVGVRRQPVVIAARRLNAQQTTLGLVVASLVILYAAGALLSTVLIALLAGAVVFLHATLRPPTAYGRLNKLGSDVRAGIKSAFSTGGSDGDAGDADDDEDAFVVRSVGEGLRAMLGIGKRRRGGSRGGSSMGTGSAAAAATAYPDGRTGKGKGKDGGSGAGKGGSGGDVEGHAAFNGSSGGSGFGAVPAGYPAPAHYPPHGGVHPQYLGGASGSSVPGMPVFFDALPATSTGSSSSAAHYEATALGGGEEGSFSGQGSTPSGSSGTPFSGPYSRRNAGAGGGAAPSNLPRPSHVRSD
jgi:hypothetical protein